MKFINPHSPLTAIVIVHIFYINDPIPPPTHPPIPPPTPPPTHPPIPHSPLTRPPFGVARNSIKPLVLPWSKAYDIIMLS
jgi:hypothetical protein